MPTFKSNLAMALDPVLLFRAATGLVPDPWQAQLLRSNAPRVLLNCSRQSGKSTAVAVLALHTALFCPGSLTLLLCPSLRQSSELFKKVTTIYQGLGRPIPPEAESALRLELATESRIISLPGKEGTVRGYSGVKLLIVDEAAFVADDLYRTIRPMLAVSQGRLLAPSTPFGKRGWWFDAWQHGGASWERYEAPATMCPRITPDFLDEERRTLGDFWFSQEYGCQFLDAQSAAFRHDDIQRAFQSEVETWTL